MHSGLLRSSTKIWPCRHSDKHAGYPPAIVQLKAEGALKENCRPRPVQYLNNVLEQDHPAIKRRVRASQHFRSFLGSLAYDLRIRGDSYDPQRPSALECGGCEGRSTAPLHSRSVRYKELNYRSSTRLSARLQSCNTSEQFPSNNLENHTLCQFMEGF
jgi:hypothetical protein